uniref:AlNc14C492G11922 protein n=1 Tax=Albugo laibachii Nc14 TaxID=890382 RepID=F0X0H8_9STRA|nr:AlNc14C492G11922 [Albugo laibachii Nc14]|eukprot:CCA27268.1 AlNc14C492G11922 [Albugo laibachii Nc14]
MLAYWVIINGVRDKKIFNQSKLKRVSDVEGKGERYGTTLYKYYLLPLHDLKKKGVVIFKLSGRGHKSSTITEASNTGRL